MALAVIACGGEPGGGATVVDSAGVRVVTSIAPAWTGGTRWTLDSDPELEVGDAAGINSTMLVAVTGARRLDDGRYVVTLDDEKRIQWFDEEGGEAGHVGRDGEGPGEFRQVQLVGAMGDSLLVWDHRLDRATVVGPDGSVGRSLQPAGSPGIDGGQYGLAIAGVFADGTLLLTGRSGVTSGDRSGYRRDTIPLIRGSIDGVAERTIVAPPGHEFVAVTTDRFVTSLDRPFGARTVVAVDGVSLLVSVGDADEVRRYDTEGRLLAIYRLDRARRIIPTVEIERAGRRLGEQVAQLPSELARGITGAMVDAGLPSVYPTYDRILVDATGAIWLREDIGAGRSDAEDRRWVVLDADGRWLGHVVTPRRFALYQVTRDRVVGIQRDDYDVELLRVHRLRR
jgi:hypothetical protein